MNENERPSPVATPESVWKSINEKDEVIMDIAFTPDRLCAMARSRDRLNIWSRRILLTLLIGLATAFAYNVVSVGQLSLRLSQAWMLAWTCLLLWKLRRRPRRMSVIETCSTFLQREFERTREGFLEIRRYTLLLIPPILISWWASGGRALGLNRLRAFGVAPSSGFNEFASGPGLFLITGVSLILVWLAFGLAAKKKERELDELRRRIRE